MPLHTTKDPVKRAEHIADREEKEHAWQSDQNGELNLYHNWPKYWLSVYHQSLKEMSSLGVSPLSAKE